MKINIKATKVMLSAQQREQIEAKFSGLDKYYDRILSLDVELGREVSGQKKGEIYFCEANASVPGNLLRYRKAFSDLTKAVNGVYRGMQQELKKEKEKNLKK